MIEALFVVLFIALLYAFNKMRAAEDEAWRQFFARVGPNINPDRVAWLYNRLSAAGRAAVKNEQDFKETEAAMCHHFPTTTVRA